MRIFKPGSYEDKVSKEITLIRYHLNNLEKLTFDFIDSKDDQLGDYMSKQEVLEAIGQMLLKDAKEKLK